MINLCAKCSKPLEDGDEVTFMAMGVYKAIPSAKYWALSQEGVTFDEDTLKHKECK